MKGVSIIICTYNRSGLLNYCLDSFTKQSVHPTNLEYLVVDNNSTDDTRAITESFKEKIPNLRYVIEPVIGLSHARNLGLKEATYDWVCYMDDDAKAYPDFLEKLFNLVEQNIFDGFGGMFYPWYLEKKPKWLPVEFGRMQLLRKDIGVIRKGAYVAGGICAFRKSLVIEAGGFPTEMGMRGKIIGYGEENAMQEKMINNGGIIGFDPSWKIDHLVADYKMKIGWHLKRSYAKGRDFQFPKGKLPLLKKFALFLRAVISPLYLSLRFLPRLLFQPHYYWQNFLIDSFGHAYQLFGKISV